MAIVTGLTAQKIIELDTIAIVSAQVNADGHLLLTSRGGTVYDAGVIRDGTRLYGEDPPESYVGAIGDNYLDSVSGKEYLKTTATTWTEKAHMTPRLETDLGFYYANLRLDGLEAPVPAGNAYRSSAAGTLTLPANTTTLIPINTMNSDGLSGGMTIESGALRVPKAGWYSISGNMTFAASTSASRRIGWLNITPNANAIGMLRGVNAVASAQDTANISTLSVSTNVYVPSGAYLYLAANVATAWKVDQSQGYYNAISAAYRGPHG